jgi:predicted DNA binding protein
VSVIADVRVHSQRLPLVSVAAAVPDTTLQFHSERAVFDSPSTYVLCAIGTSSDTLERALEDASFVEEYSLIDQDGSSRQYHLVPSVSMSTYLEERLGCSIQPETQNTAKTVLKECTVTPRGWTQTRWFATRDALVSFYDAWRAQDVPFVLERLYESPGERPDAMRLTTRQFDALRLAYIEGYFEVPRQSSLEELADELDISPQAVSERLRRAQFRLLENALSSAPT